MLPSVPVFFYHVLSFIVISITIMNFFITFGSLMAWIEALYLDHVSYDDSNHNNCFDNSCKWSAAVNAVPIDCVMVYTMDL